MASTLICTSICKRIRILVLILVLSGKLDAFDEMRLAEPLLGPLLFFAFALLVIVLLVNLFIAIIIDAYSSAKLEENGVNESELLEYVLDCANDLLDVFGVAVGRRAESVSEQYQQSAVLLINYTNRKCKLLSYYVLLFTN